MTAQVDLWQVLCCTLFVNGVNGVASFAPEAGWTGCHSDIDLVALVEIARHCALAC